MTTLIESYEQQYSNLTADITAQIGTLKLSKSDDRRRLIAGIEDHFEEANDLLEQLEIEVRGSGQSHLMTRVPCYRAELARIKTEFHTAKHNNLDGISLQSGDGNDYYDEWNVSREQKTKLLDNSDRIEKTGKKLAEGYSVLLEAEQIGATVLSDLNLQRETIQRSRNRLRETDEHLSRSTRIMNSMIMRMLQQKFVLIAFILLIVIIIGFSIYLSLK